MSDELTTTAPAAVSEAPAPVPPVAVPASEPTTQTPETKADVQTTTVDAKATAPGPPEKYDLVVPDGFADNFTPAVLAAIGKEARALGLAQDDAQNYLNAYAEHLKAEDTSREESWKQTQETWISEIKADPKLGGANFEKTQSRLNLVVSKFGDTGVKEFLDSTGAGNHPALCRMLAGIGAAMEQDHFVSGNTPVAAPVGPKAMYSNSPELK
jgi:hypothetical protein